MPDAFDDVINHASQDRAPKDGGAFEEVIQRASANEPLEPEAPPPVEEQSAFDAVLDYAKEGVVRGPGAFLLGAGGAVHGFRANVMDELSNAAKNIPVVGDSAAEYLEQERQESLNKAARMQQYYEKEMPQEILSGSLPGGGATKDAVAEEQRLTKVAGDTFLPASEIAGGAGSLAPILATAGVVNPALVAAAQSSGQAAIEAGDEPDQARRLANTRLKGAVTGLLTHGFGKIGAGGAEALANRLAQSSLGALAKLTLPGAIKGAAGEVAEEVLDTAAGDVIDTLTLDKDYAPSLREYAKVAVISAILGGGMEVVAGKAVPGSPEAEVEQALAEKAPAIQEAAANLTPEVRTALEDQLETLTGGRGTVSDTQGGTVVDMGQGVKIRVEAVTPEAMREFSGGETEGILASINKSLPPESQITQEIFDSLPPQDQAKILDEAAPVATTMVGNDTLGDVPVSAVIAFTDAATPSAVAEELHHVLMKRDLYTPDEKALIAQELVDQGAITEEQATDVTSPAVVEGAWRLYKDFLAEEGRAPQEVRGAFGRIKAKFGRLLRTWSEADPTVKAVWDATRRGEVGARTTTDPTNQNAAAQALRAIQERQGREAARPEPDVTQAKPGAARPEPEAARPEPDAAQPEPDAARPARAMPEIRRATSPLQPGAVSGRTRDLNAMRADMGMPQVASPQREHFDQMCQQAIAQGVPEKASEIAKDVLDGNLTIDHVQSAGLTLRVWELKKQRKAAATKAEEAAVQGDIAEQNRWEREVQETLTDIELLTYAMVKSGSSAARAMVVRQMALADDFSVEGVLSRAKRSKRGELSKEEAAKVEEPAKKMEDISDELGKLQTERDLQQAEQLVKEHNKGKKKQKKSRQQLIDEARELFDQGCSLT